MKHNILAMKKQVYKLFNRHISKITDENKTNLLHEYLTKTRMQAWQIHSYGDLNELRLSTSRMPLIMNSNELLVKVTAAALNPLDYVMIGGYAKSVTSYFGLRDVVFPLTLGRDFCGIITDKGQEVGKEYRIGDVVYGVVPFHKPGSLAEDVITDASSIRHKPMHLTDTEAASIMFAALTAWSALYITGEMCLHDPSKLRVLILGASGGVGTLAVQLLKAQNVTVFATCSTDAVPLILSLGVDNVYDYNDANYVKNIAENGSFDIVLDCANVGVDNISNTWKYKKFISLNSPLVKNTDAYGLIGGLAASFSNLLINNIQKCPEGKSLRWGYFAPFSTGIDFIHNCVMNQQIRPIIDKTYQFDEVPQAFERLSSGHLRGKVAIDFSNNL